VSGSKGVVCPNIRLDTKILRVHLFLFLHDSDTAGSRCVITEMYILTLHNFIGFEFKSRYYFIQFLDFFIDVIDFRYSHT